MEKRKFRLADVVLSVICVVFVAEAAARAGKASGMITSRTDVIRDCRDGGMTVLSCDSEVGMLLKMARKVMGELQA